MPLLFLGLFLTVRLNLLVQGEQKTIGALKVDHKRLHGEIEEQRHSLAGWTDFSRIEPCMRPLGLRVVMEDQVLALMPWDEPAPRDDGLGGTARWILTGLAETMGPAAAQAEAPCRGNRP
ncbi:MAG: hypothetical protein KAY24_08820 [Candidatus Eisenbacteria sp.]|nr:hypothetical protein [Candidatus Eisenbacteria bacterium]